MEVDELGGSGGGSGANSADSENQLVNMFSSMATEDKDNLVKALQGVIGSGVSPANCRFFLELANWNLSAAIGAYYDFDFSQQQQQQQHLMQQLDVNAADASGPRMAILSCQVSIGHDDTLELSCTVYNESTADCPPGCRLVCSPEAADSSGGAPLCEPCQLPSLRAGGHCSCRLILPPLPSGALYDASRPERRVRLRLHAPDDSPMSLPASSRCVDLVDLATRGRLADAVDEAEADAAAAVAAASWASVESPLTANPPPSPTQTDEQMME